MTVTHVPGVARRQIWVCRCEGASEGWAFEHPGAAERWAEILRANVALGDVEVEPMLLWGPAGGDAE